MRMSREMLIKIVDVFRSAFVEGKDASEELRNLELVVLETDGTVLSSSLMTGATVTLKDSTIRVRIDDEFDLVVE